MKLYIKAIQLKQFNVIIVKFKLFLSLYMFILHYFFDGITLNISQYGRLLLF